MVDLDAVAGLAGRGRTSGMTATYRTIRRLAVLVALSLLAPLLVTVAGPASTAAAAVSPQPIPGGLWDTAAPGPFTMGWAVLDGDPGDPVTAGADASYLQTPDSIGAAFQANPDGSQSLLILIHDDTSGFVVEVNTPAGEPRVGPGYYPVSSGVPAASGTVGLQVRTFGSATQVCQGVTTGWVAVDHTREVDGQLGELDLRVAQSCDGNPPLHAKVHVDVVDESIYGPDPVPAGLWDVTPAEVDHQDYVVVEGADGDIQSQGQDTFYVGDAFGADDYYSDLAFLLNTGGVAWTGSFTNHAGRGPVERGFYPVHLSVDDVPDPPPFLTWWKLGRPHCTTTDGWFAVDDIVRSGGHVVKLDLRLEQSCDGGPPIHAKIHMDRTSTPTNPQPVPSGLWDEHPTGVSGNYFWLQGTAGDPLTGGVDAIAPGVDAPVSAGDVAGGIEVFGPIDLPAVNYMAVGVYLPGKTGVLGTGYYGDLSTEGPTAAGLGSMEVQRRPAGIPNPCPTPQTGWYSVDRLARIDGMIKKLDLRWGYRCAGAPMSHGRVHIDNGGLEVGPPVGAFESAVPVTGGVKLEGWALDPETASAIDVDVLVDGVVTTTLNASGSRPDVGAANPLYGNGHGFSANVTVPVGAHQVCTKARNTGVGADSTLGCKTVKVGSGSPFGSFDVAYAGPSSVNVSGWAIDPDTSLPIPVHVYVDSTGVALTANGSRPDVEAAFPGLGDAHGFSQNIKTSPGTHTVCAYAINTGAGTNVGLGCKTVTVISGSPIGSLDVARLVPGVGVNVGGWAFDPDTGNSIPVHVYVDGQGTALTANGNRPDVGAVFPGYGPAHGFSSTIATGPGQHTVCAYGINVLSGANSSLGCKVVNVPTGSPIGSLDLVVGGKGYVSAGGWAADPDTASPIAVHLYVDSAGSAVTANLNRPDVGAYFPAWGPLHGWATTVNATPGLHKVCAYAINPPGGTGGNALLGCRLVVVT
jgi:hypothetical protein